ncbi:protein retrieval receptor [Ascoidea rubescens DSM 1968]|uniref:Protein RER1 n=1 Tax=Ascoidea rubescens DSM 1968 TaxID=1344418 RepID=A0A1D2VR14_9ASCO|nr:protein RER1 [Ascoidea rubescens DSM 1968]ODV64052.1 protein RER1 [Ascoidea rubescens DSM 1968]
MNSFSDTGENPIFAYISKAKISYQRYLDHITPYSTYRWLASAGLILVFLIRVLYCSGWYIICYALGIYLLSLFLQFLQPKFDPSLEQELRDESIEEAISPEEEQANQRINSNDDEFKPFIRRLPEFKFWLSATKATLISLVLSCFEIFDIPVFWPILLLYFISLFAFTMKKQIQHMIKYRYVPYDIGKTKYGSK